jgi:hypothetical protein
MSVFLPAVGVFCTLFSCAVFRAVLLGTAFVAAFFAVVRCGVLLGAFLADPVTPHPPR